MLYGALLAQTFSYAFQRALYCCCTDEFWPKKLLDVPGYMTATQKSWREKEKLLRLYRERLRHFLCRVLIEKTSFHGTEFGALRTCVIAYLSHNDWEDVCINRASMGYCGWIGCSKPATGRLTVGHLHLLVDEKIKKELAECICSVDCLENYILLSRLLNDEKCHFRTPPPYLVELYDRSMGLTPYTEQPPQDSLPLIVEVNPDEETTSTSL
eukprot:Blabericola_migrator_1__2802@NODE_17_length_22983_cov_74_609923_g14_i0_p10_GENE_NODE_17_length_22983_cov_74_609923_g14_i0NODE_17_length_22983_cov_74_609923_g14_i0_p10_ORF_typecomplete_len212_score30_62RPAP2_Rtr1/PF04181_13/5_7e06_NODE_17_length_22983_cov_74_609923_g14_i01805418689